MEQRDNRLYRTKNDRDEITRLRKIEEAARWWLECDAFDCCMTASNQHYWPELHDTKAAARAELERLVGEGQGRCHV